MAITPQTNIRLLKCPLNINNKHQLTFTDKYAQETYFKSLPYIEEDECSYQRKENIIRFPAHIDNIIEFNYVMYKNENYSDKWFYAYIINMEYKADNLTLITIGTDVWQTWQFDLNFKQSFIEREHVAKSDDTQYQNLEPENVEIGEPISVNVRNLEMLAPCFVIAYNRNPYTDGIASRNVDTANLNGMPNGVYYFVCGATTLKTKLDEINNKGLGQNVITIFSIPIGAVIGNVDEDNNEWTLQWLINRSVFGDWIWSFKANPIDINYPEYLSNCFNGYIPKNNKLYHYPFHYLGFNPPNRFTKNIQIRRFF